MPTQHWLVAFQVATVLENLRFCFIAINLNNMSAFHFFLNLYFAPDIPAVLMAIALALMSALLDLLTLDFAPSFFLKIRAVDSHDVSANRH